MKWNITLPTMITGAAFRAARAAPPEGDGLLSESGIVHVSGKNAHLRRHPLSSWNPPVGRTDHDGGCRIDDLTRDRRHRHEAHEARCMFANVLLPHGRSHRSFGHGRGIEDD